MATPNPGVRYVYESPDGGETTYARETGTTERQLIGQTDKSRSLHEQMMEDQLWGQIRRRAKSHTGLQEELERVKMLYYLVKDQK